MAFQHLYIIVSPSPEGGDKEHIETCPHCGSLLVDYDPDRLYQQAADHGIQPDWYMVKFSRDEVIDIQPSLTQRVMADFGQQGKK